MIPTYEQLQWVEADENGKLFFVGQDGATKEQREKLKQYDIDYYSVYGEHAIVNYDEI